MFDFDEQFSDEERDVHDALTDEIAYASAPVLKVRVDGEDSSIIAGANCPLPDGAITDLEVVYRQRLRELPPG